MKKLIPALTIILIICFALAIPAGALSLEQVQAAPPKFDVYLFGDGQDLSGVTPKDVTASIGGMPLRCADVSSSEQGIFYIFMLDISGSIPQAHFEAAKTAVLNTYSSMRKQDKLAVITFGNDVSLLLSGGEPEEDVRTAISALQAKDSNTKFYTAMDKLIETATQVTNMRRIAVVMSDGIDDTDAGMSQQDLEDKLKNCGISVYALCIDTAQQATTEKFSSFIKLSGGELYTFGPDNAQSVLDQLLTRLDDSLRISLYADGDVESGKELELSVNLGEYGSVSTTLSSEQWVEDTTQPYIEDVRYNPEAKTADITFSEPVEGADDAKLYTFTDESGDKVELSGAQYTGDDRMTVSVSFETIPIAGNYTLVVSAGITDSSGNDNALREYNGKVELNTGVTAEDAAAQGLSSSDIIYIVSVVLVVLAAALLVIIMVRRSRKKSAETAGEKLNKEEKKKLKVINKISAKNGKSEERFIFTNSDDKTKK